MKLSPCPFCGRTKPVLIAEGDISLVTCLRCGACGPGFNNPAIAMDLWNRSAERTKPKKAEAGK